MAVKLYSFPIGISECQLNIINTQNAQACPRRHYVRAISAVPNVGYMQAGQKRKPDPNKKNKNKKPKEKPKW
jgi:hypothetical protein